uniref:Uncharacterized protein n=1 Tax=Sphaerodactylus townsendi TaxID=933632 RepID=A0ACB8FVU9_9SAUR
MGGPASGACTYYLSDSYRRAQAQKKRPTPSGAKGTRSLGFSPSAPRETLFPSSTKETTSREQEQLREPQKQASAFRVHCIVYAAAVANETTSRDMNQVARPAQVREFAAMRGGARPVGCCAALIGEDLSTAGSGRGVQPLEQRAPPFHHLRCLRVITAFWSNKL